MRENSIACGGPTGAAMADPTGEADRGALRLDFDRRLVLEFRGSAITSDAGLLPYRELDDAVGLTDTGAEMLADARTGKNGRHRLAGLLRQSVFGRLAGYEDVNDAARLRRDPVMRWVVGDRAISGSAASASQMGRFETKWLSRPENLGALADLPGQWIDKVHQRRLPKIIVLDMDSSESPTYGEQEGTAYNGHFGCTCYHPLFVFNQFGDVERCALRSGNVHSADGWRAVLEPVIARYRGIVKRLYFRGDAAFANPEMYEFLEAERAGYTIRLPANSVLQRRIGYLLKRPVGRPSHEVRRYYTSFGYQAQSWNKPRRIVAKVEWHHQPGSVCRACRRLLQPARHGRAVRQRGQGGDQMDPVIMPHLRRQRRPPPVARARLQPGQLHADAGDAQGGGAMVTDEPAGEADQDWREGRQPWPFRDVPDGGGRGAPAYVPGNPVAHRPAAGAAGTSMRDFGIERRRPRWERCVLMKANDQVSAPQGKVTHGFHCPRQPRGRTLLRRRPKDGQNRATTLEIRGMSVTGLP
jgi:Transposase DDE domain group 1